MRKIKKLVSDKALEYLRGANNYQFRDRISKVVGDCIDQLNEFSNILAKVKDGRPGKDGKNGKDGVNGKDGQDGNTPYIKDDYWYIDGINTGIKAKGSSSWNDIENKPDIPTENTISDWGFTKNTGNYNKPDTGIPLEDLEEGIIPTVINVVANPTIESGEEHYNLNTIQIGNVKYNVPTSQSGGEDNIIESIKFNNVNVPIVNKTALISVEIPVNTDTHRPIQVDGTQILGDNTTPLNFVAGSNVTITSEEGTVTISSSDSGEDNVIEGIKISGENDVIATDNKIVIIPIMTGSGTNHRSGLVPDPGSTSGTSKYLREDGTWQVPPDNNTTYSANDFDIKDLADSTSLRSAWSGKQAALTTQIVYTSKGSATKVPQISTNSLGQVVEIKEITITQPDVSNFISKNNIVGLIKNDGTIDTNTYLTSSDLSGYVQTSNTPGLLKNDGTVDTTSYGTYSKPSGGITANDIAPGVIPTVPTKLSGFTDDLGTSPTHTHSQYLTSNDIRTCVTSTDITNIVKMTEAAYALITPDANTLYILTSS